MLGKKVRRRQYIINRRFQFSFIAYNVVTSLLVSGIFYASVRYFFWKLRKSGVDAGLPETNIFFVFITEQISMMNTIFLVAASVVGVVLAVHGIFLSHRIAGPLYHLKKHMESLSKGEVDRKLQFRRHDFFKDVERAYNEFVFKPADQANKKIKAKRKKNSKPESNLKRVA